MHIDIAKDELTAFCRKHNIVRLSFFGSVLRDDFSADSDVDVLIEFDSKSRPTFFDLIHAEDDLKKLLKTDRKLDVLTTGAIHPVIRDEIMNTREVVYEA